MKKFIYTYYWILSGLLVGVISVVLLYFNFNLILQDATVKTITEISVENSFSWLGAAEIVLEYTVIVYLISVCRKFFK